MANDAVVGMQTAMIDGECVSESLQNVLHTYQFM